MTAADILNHCEAVCKGKADGRGCEISRNTPEGFHCDGGYFVIFCGLSFTIPANRPLFDYEVKKAARILGLDKPASTRIIRGKAYESFEDFEQDLEANPIGICFDEREEQGQLYARHKRLEQEWNSPPASEIVLEWVKDAGKKQWEAHFNRSIRAVIGQYGNKFWLKVFVDNHENRYLWDEGSFHVAESHCRRTIEHLITPTQTPKQ